MMITLLVLDLGGPFPFDVKSSTLQLWLSSRRLAANALASCLEGAIIMECLVGFFDNWRLIKVSLMVNDVPGPDDIPNRKLPAK